MSDNVGDLGKEFSCQDLVDNMGYQKGDTIQFRAAATNSFGDSEWAYPTTANTNAFTFSMLLL